MSLLNLTNDGRVPVLVSLWRAINTTKKIPEKNLIQMIAPEALLGDDSDNMVKKTLSTWKNIGVFKEDKGALALHKDFINIDVDDLNKFRTTLVKFILSKNNNPWILDDENNATNCSDFTRAICWTLMQDPYFFPKNFKEVESLQNKQKVNPVVFVNDTRWNGLRNWAEFLGFGQYVGFDGRFIPNPTFVIESVLPGVFDGLKELSQDVFFKRLAKELPVLDGGLYRKSIADQVGKPWREEKDHELSPTLALAIRSHVLKNNISLESKSDAPGKNRTLVEKKGIPTIPFSHIVNLMGKL